MRQRGSHRAGTFSAIKAAGIRLIYEHGYEAMTLRMLARSVGLESGSLYYHIKDKQDFLFRLLKEIIEANLAALDEKLAGLESPEEQIRAFICFFISHQWEKKEEAFIINSEVRSLTPENYEVISALSHSFRDRVEEIISKGVSAGKFRVRNVTVAAIAICDILGGPARWYYPKELLVRDEIMEMITDMIFRLLGAERPYAAAATSVRHAELTPASSANEPSMQPAEIQPKAGPAGYPSRRLWAR
ncbi:MAG TPA: TetR/AcrR family transcriptional regulator [Candidatus Binataceae bacterium]|jgi:AcrR family transcriptional regulator|nr:TetR/AcrR family transcriptional regulator [Candidatus Binataceae bacterium]